MEAAIQEFRRRTNDSLAANTVIDLLTTSLKAIPPEWGGAETTRYSEGSRNQIVAVLAADVEQRIGACSSLMFRTPGELHDALQALLDTYLDCVDGVAATAAASEANQ
jgi:hypothetical protein